MTESSQPLDIRHGEPTDAAAAFADAGWTLAAGAARLHQAAHGGLTRIDADGVVVNLFVGDAAHGSPSGLWLRVDGKPLALTGPDAALHWVRDADGSHGRGRAAGLQIDAWLCPSAHAARWAWHVQVTAGAAVPPRRVEAIAVQDVGLAAHGGLRLNEFYTSHYIDLRPLPGSETAPHGVALAARQNLPVAGRHPWALMTSLGRAASWATSGLQWHGLAQRASGRPQALDGPALPSRRLQHEQALLALQDEAQTLVAGQSLRFGFAVGCWADHSDATSADDAERLAQLLADPCTAPPTRDLAADAAAPPPRDALLLASAPPLAILPLDDAALARLAPPPWRHVEAGRDGATWSFFHGDLHDPAHLVTAAKELAVERPHGHLIRTGQTLLPDEAALTSTLWMGGVFHSLLTQGHVSANRLLSSVRGLLAQDSVHGLRVLLRTPEGWRRLGLPSGFEMRTNGARWLYRHAGGLIEVRSRAVSGPDSGPDAMTFEMCFLEGPPWPARLTLHLALDGDDGEASTTQGLPRRIELPDGTLRIAPAAGSAMAARFPGLAADGQPRGFVIRPERGAGWDAAGGDERLHGDGRSRGRPLLVLDLPPQARSALRIESTLVDAAEPAASLTPRLDDLQLPNWRMPTLEPTRDPAPEAALDALAEILPWWRQNALVHYLAPRGLEQFSGGGWGTRDVCQGPLEMLLALGQPEPVRGLLERVFVAQDPSGDWPQWFMFFERDRAVRAGDSHGDIVFWPLLGLARYLIASGDLAFLDQELPFHAADPAQAERATVWQHVERALAVIHARRIPATTLAAYGHGDWNDALQPADPAMRDTLCSAWTVTLHHQMLTTLARALHRTAASGRAAVLAAEAMRIEADFQRLLVVDGEIAGYALFDGRPGEATEWLLHPRDDRTGVRHGLLPMMHAVIAELLTPEQARRHRALIAAHLSGPDGARLFDRPIPYDGGLQHLFQRAETAAYFGREIGVMYMHAHIRWAEMLAVLGEGEALRQAIDLIHPVALRERLAIATPRQANCYFSSSDAAFATREEAADRYAEAIDGRVPLAGGWRVYSSGPGIAIGLVVTHLLGIRQEHGWLVLDPVLAPALDGLQVQMPIGGRPRRLRLRRHGHDHGVARIAVDGREVPFTRRPNRYRRGAAALAMQDLGDGERIEIDLGG